MRVTSAASGCVVVGCDGSEEARDALGWAAERASGDRLLLIVHGYGAAGDQLGHKKSEHELETQRARGQ